MVLTKFKILIMRAYGRQWLARLSQLIISLNTHKPSSKYSTRWYLVLPKITRKASRDSEASDKLVNGLNKQLNRLDRSMEGIFLTLSRRVRIHHSNRLSFKLSMRFFRQWRRVLASFRITVTNFIISQRVLKSLTSIPHINLNYRILWEYFLYGDAVKSWKL